MESKFHYGSNGEVFGLLISGFSTIGVAVGTLIGFMIGNGTGNFFQGGWIYTIIGLILGPMVGVGLSMIVYAIICKKSKH